ncbi:type I-E CRISPR-associated protein Cse1/CasA [Testudinibacter sp. TR-2022]|uniref:type I-E CRISPR-associated protein Cse1/CasA n=1 Tax=Testudinibacter sp. TR-2022 TaxID=2585029 RepID=UPI00111BB730|nr:type I-E CRISPR-associated protein Cse1/CasA [Testudinibacter sp. TR-2022]TNH06047.1 type I-E CRISPR-associated protein Cse1/CasA [Pasteurellaceae bacterium Phil11]TNH24266.1 type I-E CRISPR-associated protein Cse1/CasA [Testudinibacter sp. TR-2022]TNH26857.1 type I-E CRISPR-associated protein Cse1/CasA [Testudinibacter sp. TR-2022]
MGNIVEEQSVHQHARFNLIDSPWIPVVNRGLVSLQQIFSDPALPALGGSAIQQIALIKLFSAIAQAAHTPQNDQQWYEYSAEALGQDCLRYLADWHDHFYLYGQKPFLQMPAIRAAAVQEFGAVLPEISTGNTTVLTQIQQPKLLSDADKALLLLVLMGFALGGKKTDNTVVLSPNYRVKTKDNGKGTTGKAGTSLGFLGMLHSFYLGSSILETVYLNLLTKEDIQHLGVFNQGLGRPPWEQMPTGEDDEVARKLKDTLMGRLLPLGRFCLLAENGLHYSEGIQHYSYKEEKVADPTVALNLTGKEGKVLWVNPEKRPWRELTALLSFISTPTFDCPQLSLPAFRIKNKFATFGIWSGGLRVSSNAGEQYVSGLDDFVIATISLHRDCFGQTWFTEWQKAMSQLDKYASTVYKSVYQFYTEQKLEAAKQAAAAANQFWQLCEQQAQALVIACQEITEDQASNPEPLNRLYRTFIGYSYQIYEQNTMNETGRQMETWAKCHPRFVKASSSKERAS